MPTCLEYGRFSQHRTSLPAILLAQSQFDRAAMEVRQEALPLFHLLFKLQRVQAGHLRLPGSYPRHLQRRVGLTANAQLSDFRRHSRILNYDLVKYSYFFTIV